MYNRLLDTFICVADCGSLNRAAEKLFLSPTAVMKQINQLESHLQLKLLQRTNRGMTLTACGQSLYKDAKFMMDYSEKAIAKARGVEARQKKVFRVGTSMLNPCKTFMDLWYRLSDQFPQVTLQIIPFEDDHKGILAVIEKLGRDFDFMVGVCDSAQWLERCRMYPLGRYKKCVSVPVGHRLASRKKLKVTDLYGETLMMVRRGDSPVNDRIRADIERYHPAIHIEDTEQFYDIDVFNRCEQTGHVLLNVECWKDIHPSLVTLPVEWDYTIPYGLLCSPQPGQELAAFLQAAQSCTS